MQEKYFDTGKVRIHYLDSGPSSSDPMVMLHGGAWCWQEYLSLIPAMSKQWHVYALDLRGNGQSGWVPSKYCLEDFTQDNVQFLNQLNSSAVLIGHSIGGVIAVMVAARCRERVKALILEDIPLTLDHYQEVIDLSRDMFSLWLNLKKSAQSEEALALLLASKYQDFPGVTSEWILFFAGCLWKLDPTFFNNLLNDFSGFTRGFDCKEILRQLRCPILFIRGEPALGAVMTDDEVLWLEQNVTNVNISNIKGVGHLLHLENQGQTPVLMDMLRFLDRIPSAVTNAQLV